MNKLLILFLITLSLGANAQVGKIKVKKEKEKKENPVKPVFYSILTFDLYYGCRAYDKDYYNQLNTPAKMDIKLPMSFAGVGISGWDHYTKNQMWVFQANYYKIIPTRVMIEDSLNTKLSGYVFGYGFGPSIATRRKRLSVAAYLGFNTGRTTLSKNDVITLKNQFFSPKVTLQPKLIIKRFVLSLMLEAEYDVSNPKWKQTVFERKDLYLLQPFHQSCYTAVVSIGYKYFH